MPIKTLQTKPIKRDTSIPKKYNTQEYFCWSWATIGFLASEMNLDVNSIRKGLTNKTIRHLRFLYSKGTPYWEASASLKERLNVSTKSA